MDGINSWAVRKQGIKVPKQWMHWAQCAGLKPLKGYKTHGYVSTLKGRGYFWRVTELGQFQRSCRIADFDRWANSTDAYLPFPQYRKEFLATVQIMIHDTGRAE